MKRIQLKPGLPQRSRLQANHEPLYKRLPSHDEDGKFLSDFMMLIPGIRDLGLSHFETRLTVLNHLLEKHDDVVFADLNTPLNLLWVSVRARHGIIREVSSDIRIQFPEARLVGHTVADRQTATTRNQDRFKTISTKISALLGRQK